MKKLRQFDSLVIEELTKEAFHQPTHGQTYYEVVFIIEGQGDHFLNDSPTPYKTGDVFFISPNDTHYLDIKSVTRFGVIKFTDSYVIEKMGLISDKLLKYRPDTLMNNRGFKETKLVWNEQNLLHASRVFRNLLDCRQDKNIESSHFVFFQLLSLFSLFYKSWEDAHLVGSWYADKETLISYIHQHIYEPEKIQVKSLAHTFNISVNYFSTYFTNNYGLSLRQYVHEYRMKLIENRIRTGYSAKRIAAEFGFNDESHLSHYFKKRSSFTLSEYRHQQNHRNTI